MPHTATISETITGIVRLHVDEVEQYKKALHENKELELDIRSIFERIIELSKECRDELLAKQLIKEDGNFLKGQIQMTFPVPGKADRKEILAICLRNELAILNAYTTALSFTHDQNLKKILLAQQDKLQQLHSHIKKYHDAS